MQHDRNEFKVGLTVAVVTVLFLGVLVFVGKWDTLFAKTKDLQVRFHHTYGIQGLRTNDPVRIGGVNVGRVRSIWHEKDKDTGQLYVHVLADIPEFIDVYSDAQITVGTKFVGEGGTLDVLDTGRSGRTKDVIDGMAVAGLTRITATLSRELDATNPEGVLAQIKQQLNVDVPTSLLAKIHASLDDLNAISANIHKETDAEQQATLMAKIHQIVNQLNDVTTALKGEFDRHDKQAALTGVHTALDHLNASLKNVRDMIDTSRPNVETAITHIQTTAKRIDENISLPIANELDRTNKDSLLTKIHASISAAQIGMENINELVVINRENLQAMIDDLVETSSHLKATAKELRRNPWRLLYKPDKPEREYANLMATARTFSDAAGSLDQANSKLTQLMKLDPKRLTADDPQLIQIREQIKQAYCQFEQAQEKLWKLLKLKG